MLIEFLIVCLCIGNTSGLSKEDALRWVAPGAHEWKNSDIPQAVKVYWENRWAKASLLEGCSEENSLRVVPVYFWPGERVDLPCKLCEMAYLTNGRVKRWGYAENVDEFLLNPTQFVRVNELWTGVSNTEHFDREGKDPVDMDDVILYPIEKNKKDNKTYVNRVKEPPRYWQHEGKLTIFGADMRAQGVYFCFDEFSRKQTTLFFVLSAMLPPVHIHSEHPEIYNDRCGTKDEENSKKFVFPSFNWRFHYLPMGDFNPPPTCQLDPTDEEGCVKKFPYLKKDTWPSNLAADCSMDKCRAKLYSPGDILDLFVEVRWDAWTSCEGDQPTKRREGHCYLLRGQGSINIESMAAEDKKLYAWIRNLETVFDQKPFDTQGIRLFSSLIVSAIFDKPKITGCYNKLDDEEGLYEKYDQVWRKVFLPTFGVPTDPDVEKVVQLRNPFEACLRYTRHEKKRENIVGTHSTQVDYC